MERLREEAMNVFDDPLPMMGKNRFSFSIDLSCINGNYFIVA
jgi:hypothetical protein